MRNQAKLCAADAGDWREMVTAQDACLAEGFLNTLCLLVLIHEKMKSFCDTFAA
jgi:hypothetical protein